MYETLDALNDAHRARLQEVPGGVVPLGYGDFAGEVAAIEQQVGVLDWEACGVMLVRGPDAAVYLHGLTTNDVQALLVGRAQHNLLCANRGKILHHVLVVRTKDTEFLVVTDPGELDAAAAHLELYHIREDLQLGRAPLVRLDVLGPGAEAAVQAVGLQVGAGALFAEKPAVAATNPLGLPCVSVFLPAATAPALAEALLQQAGTRMVGLEAYDEARIWARVPRAGVDYAAGHLPAEGALYDHLSFTKGCYVGQETHARMHHRGHPNRKLAAVDIPAAVAEGMAAGSALYHEGVRAGELTSLARLERDGVRRGIAMLRYQVLQQLPALAAAEDAAPEVAVRPLASDLGQGRP